MVNFFIGRPIFATVLAILMLLIGGICIGLLPVSLYPDIVPPQVQITATYTGADAQTVADSVTTPIEQKVNGVNGMIYMSSDSTSNGVSRILVTLDVGYSQDIGAIDVQNKVDTAKPTLPPEVTQVGVESKKTTTNMVCVVNLVSPKGTHSSNFLDNYAQINIVDQLKRIRGISDLYVFGRKYAMRIWLDPDKMASQQISPDEVIGAIKSENRQAAAGKIGAPPSPPGQRFEFPVTAKGRLSLEPEFANIIVRARPDGSKVLLKDVARVELGSETYEQAGYLSGKAAATIPIYQYSNANAPVDRRGNQARDGRPGPEVPGRSRVPYCVRYDEVRSRRISTRSSTRWEKRSSWCSSSCSSSSRGFARHSFRSWQSPYRWSPPSG